MTPKLSPPTSSDNCIFCKIVSGAIPAPKIHEDEQFICIADQRPQARQHFLVIPKKHISSLETAFPEMALSANGSSEMELMGRMLALGTHVARTQGLLPSGFRSVINTNENGGQTVYHIHLHILGGEALAGDFGR